MRKDEWKGKIERARYVERNILRWIRKTKDPKAKLVEGYDPEKDIISEVMGDIEIKEDRLAHETENYVIEFENGLGKPSGINIITAKHWVIVDNENVGLMATESLKFILKDSGPFNTVDIGFKFEDGTKSKGWLVPRYKILNSPFVEVTKKWFPTLKDYEFK